MWVVVKGKREDDEWFCDAIWRGCPFVLIAVASWFAESLALSSANASQNALCVMKLSFL